jgi:spore coat protein U-like protein
MKKLGLAIFLALVACVANAGTATSNMNATASLNASCVFSMPNVEFNNYDPSFNQDQTTTQAVAILCTKGTPWKFYTGALDLNSNNQYSYMSFNTYKLVYQVQLVNGAWENDLYSNAALNASYTYTGTGTGNTQNLSLNYRILKNQYVPVGNYLGNVTAYIVF